MQFINATTGNVQIRNLTARHLIGRLAEHQRRQLNPKNGQRWRDGDNGKTQQRSLG